MTKQYNAADIEVLTGLEPVRKRPGMYTNTSNPNHLAQEVIDNSVDEAIAGYANHIEVILHLDGSLSVRDNGRGMPVDLHPEEGISGVEVILTRLHAGGKFSNQNYQFAGGLHGVGISVVNALSSRLEVTIKRNGMLYQMSFAHGEKTSELNVIGTVGQRHTGTTVRFWPNLSYFDSPQFSVAALTYLVRAKAVLCAGLTMTFSDENTGDQQQWFYQDGLSTYLLDQISPATTLPEVPLSGHFAGTTAAVDYALLWIMDGKLITESYVNLIPTPQGGTHVNGLRSGLLEALREFCDYRHLLPRGIKLAAEDIWENCAYVLSVKLADPQFAGQTKERLHSRTGTTFVAAVVRDAVSLWLNQHVEMGEQLAEKVIEQAQQRLRADKKVIRKQVTNGPALPGKLADCTLQEIKQTELFLVEGDSAGGSCKQARDRTFQAVMPLRGKILNTWEIETSEVLASQEVHDIAIALGIDPGTDSLSGLRYGKVCILADADSDGAHIATLLCALFVKHFRKLVAEGHVYVATPPLYRIDVGNTVYYALNDEEKQGILDTIAAEKKPGAIHIQRFKGLGEMNPLQLRETTMARETRRLIQLTLNDNDQTDQVMDMLLAKKRSPERKIWLEQQGHLAMTTIQSNTK